MVSEFTSLLSSPKVGVLILVLVEDGLGVKGDSIKGSPKESLNPCFSGGWSRRTLRNSLGGLK